MYETLMRPHEVNQVPSLKSVRKVGEELKDMAVRREERRLRQIAFSAASKAKRKREEACDVSDLGEMQQDASLKRLKTSEREDCKPSASDSGAEIRACDNDNDGGGVSTNESTNLNFATDPEGAALLIEYSDDAVVGAEASPIRTVGSVHVSEPTASGSGRHLNVSKVFPEVRGHTSYLTFACLVPFPPDATPRNPVELVGGNVSPVSTIPACQLRLLTILQRSPGNSST
jgi:tRNA (adenine57-N1/adenine58-N1)-methyltransferase